MKRLLLIAALGAGTLYGLYAATLAGAAYECEACVRWEGREACKSATGADREEAERAAITTACALVARGVTASIGCQGIEPVSLSCTEP